jgi:SAM-dependent methyltransferase
MLELSTVVERLIAEHAPRVRAVLDGTGPAYYDLADGVAAHRAGNGPCQIGERWYGIITAAWTTAVLRVEPNGAIAIGTRGEQSFEPYQAIRRLIDDIGGKQDGPSRLQLLKDLYRQASRAKEPEYTTVPTCPCCSTDPHPAYGLSRCGGCGTWYRAGASDEAWAGVYRDRSGVYFRGLADPVGVVPRGYKDYTEWSEVILGPVHFDRRVRLVMRVSGLRGGRAVDVGCATGAMAAALARHGFVAHGVDLSPYCVREAEDRYAGATFAAGTVSDVDGPVELVTYLDVFEHVSDPRAELAAVRELLAKGGVLLLELPNQASADAEVLGTDYLLDEHMFFHVPTGIRRLLDSCGFDVLDVRTAHDSYFRVQDVVGEPYARGLAESGRGERLVVVARRR